MNDRDPKKSSAQQDPQQVVDAFFSGPGGCEVEARNALGLEADARPRHIVQFMKKMASVVAATVFGTSAAVGAMTLAEKTMEHYEDHKFSQERSQANWVAGRSKHQEREQLVRVVSKEYLSSSPTASLYTNSDKKFVCTVNLFGVEKTARSMLHQMADTSAERFRDFVINHEASHCEFMANRESFKLYGDNKQIVGTNFTFSTLDKLHAQLKDHFQKEFKLGESMSDGAMEALSESYADARSMLIMAASDIGNAQTPEDRQSKLEEFIRFSGRIASSRVFNDQDRKHDTGNMILGIQQFVINKSLTKDGLDELHAIAKDPAKASSHAMQWSVSNMIENSQKINAESMRNALLEQAKNDGPNSKTVKANVPGTQEMLERNEAFRLSADNFTGEVKDMINSFRTSYNEARIGNKIPPVNVSDVAPSNKVTQQQAADLARRIHSSNFLGTKPSPNDQRRKHPALGLR